MSRAVLIAALRRTTAMADTVLREAMQADPNDPLNKDDELALRRIEWLVDALEADADASQPMSLRPKDSRDRRPILLDLTPDEQLEVAGATFAEIDRLAATTVFKCGTCRDTGTEHKEDRNGKLRPTGRVCPECTSVKRPDEIAYIESRRTGRRLKVRMELFADERVELTSLAENGPDGRNRQLARAILAAEPNAAPAPDTIPRMDGVVSIQSVTANGEIVQVRVFEEPRCTVSEEGNTRPANGDVAYEGVYYCRGRPLPPQVHAAFTSYVNGTRSGVRIADRRMMAVILEEHDTFDLNEYEVQHLSNQHIGISQRARGYLRQRGRRDNGDLMAEARREGANPAQPVAPSLPPRENPIVLRWGTRIDMVSVGVGLTIQERARFIGQLDVAREQRVLHRVLPGGDVKATEMEISEVLKADTNYRFRCEGAEYALGDFIPARHRAFMQEFARSVRADQARRRLNRENNVPTRRGVQAMMAEHLLQNAPALDPEQVAAETRDNEWSFGMTEFPYGACVIRLGDRMDDWQRDIIRAAARGDHGDPTSVRLKAANFLDAEPTYSDRPAQGTPALPHETILVHYIKIGTSSSTYGVETLRPGDVLNARQRESLMRSAATISNTPLRNRRIGWERRMRFIRRVIDASDIIC